MTWPNMNGHYSLNRNGCNLQAEINTELAIYALEQVHCWGTYFRARTGQFENFTHLNF
jgi:hypothetical protein